MTQSERLQLKSEKQNHKNQMKNMVLFNEKRSELINHLISSEMPNWNIKLGILK